MSISLQNLKIALVHDWLTEVGGAEKVLKTLHEMFPVAPVYVLFHDKKFTDGFMPTADIQSSKYQKLYKKIFGRKLIVPFLPLAAESIDLSDFDLVISTAPFVKGLILRPKTTHINYCNSPTRQFWDWQSEHRNEKHISPKWTIALFQHIFRLWDRPASIRVDDYIANSENVRTRIKKYYKRNSTVIYPPVEIGTSIIQKNAYRHISTIVPIGLYDGISDSAINSKLPTNGYFLIISRLFPHKNIELAIRAFNKLSWPLVIVGDGPDFDDLKRISEKNIQLLGWQPDVIVQDHLKNCSAFILPQEEDFGIAPIEAMNFGKPVLALKRGGALEYIIEGVNGEYFEDPCEEMLADGARRLMENINRYDPEEIKKSAERFSRRRFEEEIETFINWVISGRDSIRDNKYSITRQTQE
ncbi:MAG: glycosyltransferase [Minisyncoccia bacterium]|jgi:glycosyltransferase involved in cell wall biosynthesis